MKQVVKGDALMCFLNNKAMAWATNHVLSLSSDTEEIQTKDHGNFSATLVNKISWECTCDALYVETDSQDGYETLRTAMLAMQPVNLVFGKAGNFDQNGNQNVDENATQDYWKPTSNGGTYYGGQAIITSLQLNAQSGSNANYSVTFTGAGPYAPVTIS